jgi:lipid-A-disaccharide synthase
MLVIFPFEEQFYRERGVQAEFVGHPLADLPLPAISRKEFASSAGLDPDRPWIALLPGSRAKEIRDNLPEMIQAAILLFCGYHLEQGNSEPQFIIPLAPTLTAEECSAAESMVSDLRGNLTIRTIGDTGAAGASGPTAVGARAALFHARASIVASGTATVEAALIGNPFVVVYRVSPLTYAIAKRVVTVPHVAMANLIAGKRVVPELIQNEFTAANIVQHIKPLLSDGPPRESMKQELKRIRTLLSTGPKGQADASSAIDRVAAITLECLGVSSPVAESVQS